MDPFSKKIAVVALLYDRSRKLMVSTRWLRKDDNSDVYYCFYSKDCFKQPNYDDGNSLYSRQFKGEDSDAIYKVSIVLLTSKYK